MAAGLLLWLVTLSLAVGFAAFAFLGMPSKTNLAISMQVLGNAVAYLWSAARSRNPEVCLQASPIPAIAYAEFLRHTRSKGLSEEAQVSTLLCFIWLSTLVLGVALAVCAECRMGTVLQYFPTSVTTGYVGGVGLLVLNAALSMLAGVNPMQDPAGFVNREKLLLALPGVLLAAVIYPVSKTKACSGPVFKVLPILAAITGFYAVLRWQGISVEESREGSWVFPYYGRSHPTDAFASFQPVAVDWELLRNQGTPLALLTAFLSVVAQYSSVGGILLRFKGSTKDADDESRHAGWSNALSGLLGAMPSLSGMAPSAVCAGALGPEGRAGPCLAICGLLHMGLFFSGLPLISFLPKCSIAGCLLIPSALGMVQGALFDSTGSSTVVDCAVIWLISGTILVFGIQTGLIVGFALNAGHLLVQCAHLNIVSHWDSLAEMRTVKDRNPWTRRFLTRHGQEAVAFHLRGVLFFGNCVSLKQTLTSIIDGEVTALQWPPKFLVLDFAEVVSVDSSVWEVLASTSDRAMELAATEVLLCGLSEKLLWAVASQGELLRSRLRLDFSQQSCLHLMEQLEDRILATAGVRGVPQLDGLELLAARVAAGLPASEQGSLDLAELRARLDRYFERSCHTAGELLATEGHEAMAFYWIESGEFHLFARQQGNRDAAAPPASARGPALLAEEMGLPVKGLLYRKVTRGSGVGFEAFCHEWPVVPALTGQSNVWQLAGPMQRWTSMQCKHDGAVLRLSREGFGRMRAEDPPLCLAVVLMAASQRESLMRQLCRYQFAPEVVEVEETDQPGCFKRRRFTDTLKTGQAQISMALKSQALSVTNPNRLSMLASLRTRVARALQARRLRAVPAGPASFA